MRVSLSLLPSSCLMLILSLPAKFPKQRALITDLTIRTLEDKTSSARRYAIQLLCKLLETHPFGAMHGGTLNLPEWQERYEEVSKELEKVDAVELEKAKRDLGVQDEEDEPMAEDGEEGESTQASEAHEGEEADGEADPDSTPRPKKQKPKPRQSQLDITSLEAEQSSLDPALVQRLRLTKKYYSDALAFMHQLEKAIPLLCTLLVSTTKTEVLESIRFFRVAYEYNVQGAEIGIKRMLHLIWTKDNNATTTAPPTAAGEEGKEQVDERSIKGQLIETYKSLYFDAVEGLSPKHQVGRIAKNMIE